MADKTLSKIGWRGFSGSQASVGAIALMAFLLVASLLPLIMTSQSEVVEASPGYPVVAAENGGNTNTNETEHTVNLPADIGAGDLLLIFFASDGATTITFPEGWTQMFQTQSSANVTFGAWYRAADGEEGTTITVTASAPQRTAHTSYRITGHSGTPESGTAVTASSANPNPPSLTPTWGAKDTLWFAACGYHANKTVTAYPTDYTDGRNDYADSTFGCGLGSARREVDAESEDPDTFTISDVDYWVANTVAIQPAEAPPAAPGKPVLVSPENNHSTSDNTPTFVWENGSDATSHRLVIDNSQDFDDGENIYDNTNAWDNSGTAIENELPVDNYWWKVAGVANSTENWSENTWTFEITEVVGEEYERPIDQGFSLTGLAPKGAEFGRVIEQGFSIGAAVGMVMVVCRLLSQAFGITGTIGVTSEWGKSLSQDFSLTGDVSANMERWGAIDQTFSVDGVVSRGLEAGGNVVQSFSLIGVVGTTQEVSRDITQDFSIDGGIEVSKDMGITQGFSITGEVEMGAEYARPISQTFSISDSVSAMKLYQVIVSITPENQSGTLGDTLTYAVTVLNIGAQADNYDLTSSDPQGWATYLDNDNFHDVPSGENRTTILNVALSTIGTHTVTVTATSQTDGSVSDSDNCMAVSATEPEVIPIGDGNLALAIGLMAIGLAICALLVAMILIRKRREEEGTT